MSDFSNVTPKFEVKSIFVNQREINVRGALLRPGHMPFNPWLGSSEFMKYLNLYLIAVDSAAIRDLRGDLGIKSLANPSTRVDAAINLIDPRPAIERWESALTRDVLNIVSVRKINMEEILQQQSFATDALSGQETEIIPQSDLSITDIYDTYFEVDIPMQGTWWNEGAHWPRLSGLDLLCFFHFDLSAFTEDFGQVPGAPGLRLSTIGGPMVHEPVLKYSAEDDNYYVPDTKEVFFLPNGHLWSGLVEHLEDGNFRAVRGTPRQPLDQGRPVSEHLLTKRTVTNNKVKSSLFFDTLPRNHEGETLVSGNQYDGLVSLFGNPTRVAFDPGNINFGDDLLSSLKSALGFLSAPQRQNSARTQSYSETTRQKMLQLAISREKQNNLNIVNCTWKGSSSPGTDFSWVNIRESERPFYGSILCLNTEELIRSNSPFGYLFSYHRKLPESQLNPGTTDASRSLSESFIINTVANSRFNLFRLKRRRVTEIPNINNSVATPESDVYDRDEPDFRLISTRSEPAPLFHPGFLAHSLQEATNNRAQIKELANLIQSPFGLQKILKIEDYDLFDNVNGSQPAASDQYPSGPRFEYLVEIMVEDGIRKYLENKLSELEASIKVYNDYVKEASRPYISHLQRDYFDGYSRQSSARSNMGTNPYGNYNYSNDTFRPDILDENGLVTRLSYESVAEARRFRSDRLVALYAEIIHVLSKIYMSPASIDSLKNSLLPSGGATLGNLNYFLEVCQKLLVRLEEMTYSDKRSVSRTMNFGTHKRRVSSSDNFPKRMIHISGPTGIKVHAIRKNSVFFEPRLNVPFSSPLDDLDLNRDIVLAERFFGLDADMFMPNLNVMIPQGARDSILRSRRMPTVITIASAQEFSTKTLAILNSRVIAAVERSKTGPSVSKRREESNDMTVFNSLLKRHKGLTFGTLLSKSFNISNTTEKTEKLKKYKKKKVLSDKQESTIFKFLMESEDFDHFSDIVEQKYKDFWFTRSTLKSTYMAVLNLLSATRVLEDYTVSKTSTYKDIVLHPGRAARKQRKKSDSFFGIRGVMSSTIMSPYYLTTSHGLVHSREVKRIPPIYNTGIIFYKALNTGPLDICPANNCLVSMSVEPLDAVKRLKSISSTLSEEYTSGSKRNSPYRATRTTPSRGALRDSSSFTRAATQRVQFSSASSSRSYQNPRSRQGTTSANNSGNNSSGGGY